MLSHMLSHLGGHEVVVSHTQEAANSSPSRRDTEKDRFSHEFKRSIVVHGLSACKGLASTANLNVIDNIKIIRR